MSSLIYLSLLALTTYVNATPLSTYPLNAPRQPLSFGRAPILDLHHPHGTINSSYIVVFKPEASLAMMENHFNFLQFAHSSDPFVAEDGLHSGIRHIYDHINGYSGRFTDNVLDQIRSMPEVDYIERDQVVRALDIQKSAPWGLARISHRPRLTFSTFTKYEYEANGGEGVDVYVIDTGINILHEEFEGRAKWGKTIPLNDVDEDGNGHGTHCAGTIASRKYGVAKGARVIAVKVLGSNGSGSMSDVISGVQYAVDAAEAKAKAAKKEYAATGRTAHKGSVANMSLGGGKSPSLDRVVNAAVDRGLHFAVAAGNDNHDACDYSPAGAEKAVTVGASTLGDERAYFSNWGQCVDVFGPGLNILSTYIGGTTATATLSGTSMASPHTAGLLAYLLSIYPCKTFDPRLTKDVWPEAVSFEEQYSLGRLSSIYSFTHAAMPSWISEFLPPPEFITPIPTPPTLTPLQLKKALIALSSEDMLANLPEKTPNLLIFNNATY